MNKSGVALALVLASTGVSGEDTMSPEAFLQQQGVEETAKLFLICTDLKMTRPRDGQTLPWSATTTLAITLSGASPEHAVVIQQAEGDCRTYYGKATEIEIRGECHGAQADSNLVETVRLNRITGAYQRSVQREPAGDRREYEFGTCTRAERKF